MEKKRFIEIILIVLIIIGIIAFAYIYLRGGMVSRLLPTSDDIGFQFIPTNNFIALEVKNRDIAINDFKKIEVLGKININLWKNNLRVYLIGENKEELAALLLKECEKIGKVLKYSLNEGLDTSKRTEINVSIDLVVSGN